MPQTRLTKLGKLFLALMALLYGASVTSQSGLLLLLIGLIGGCFAVNWSFARRSVQNVILKAPREEYLVESSNSTQPWQVTNPYKKHFEMMEAYSDGKLLFRLPVVRKGDVISVVPQLHYDRRGVYPHSKVTISSAAPYGLVCARRSLEIPGEVVVLPRAYDTESPAAVGLDFISGGKFRGNRRVNSGAHFAGVRPWQPGDALKQVHWNTTARRDQLMVKTFEEELGGRVSLLLDCAPANPLILDNAVRAAASLGIATLQEGHHCEFLTHSEPIRLAPFTDEKQLLEMLARYQPGKESVRVNLQSIWRKSALAIVGTSFRPEWSELLNAAARQNRTVHLYLPENCPIPELNLEVRYFSHNDIFAADSKKLARS